MTESVNCPFCGNIISSDALRCEKCGALFKEPELPGIKFTELGPFIAIDILTLGFFSTIWFFINAKAINRLASGMRDLFKVQWLFLLLAINGGFYLFFFYKHPAYLITFAALQCIIYIAFTYRVLRIIQKYTEKTYDAAININPWYVVLFNIFYLIHFIDTYKERVQGVHVHFDWKSPQGFMLILLILIIIFILRFYNEMYLLLH